MPIANAGADQQVLQSGSSASTMLDGAASADQDGVLVAHRWSQIAGPGVAVITSPNSRQTVVTGLQPGVYGFMLTVTDDSGALASDAVTVTVQLAPNLAPVADAGADQQIMLPAGGSAMAVLDGSASHDPDGVLVAHQWRLLAGPAGAVIVSPRSVQTPVTGLQAGLYSLELRVTDARGASASDQVQLTVLRADGPPAGPTARAGADQVLLLPLNAATLDGSASSTPDGGPLRFFWQQVGGPAEGLASGHDLPRLKLSRLVRGSYRFRLTVTDAQGRSATDEVGVTVRRAGALR